MCSQVNQREDTLFRPGAKSKLLIVEWRRGEVEPGGEGEGEGKEHQSRITTLGRFSKMESLKRGKPVKKVLREILNEWGKQKEDLA